MAVQNFYQVGGSLRKDLPSYIERKADLDLYQGLQKGEFCYVLAARQMGKSSLSIRMMKRLTEEGWTMAYIDLTAFGTTGFNAEQWYFSFLEEVAYMLEVETDLPTWWEAHQSITPVNRMSQFWEEVVLTEINTPIAIFIDEIDAMLGIDEGIFRTNDFFSAIRAAYNKRSTNTEFNRLNFSIFGVATPQDLMNRKNGTPFNIGKAIQVIHFTEKEAASLKNGLANEDATNQAMLHRILHWTGGQPFLTQTLCQKLSETICSTDAVDKIVDKVVKEEFLRKDILNTPHFGNIEARMIGDEQYNVEMLEIYENVLEKTIYPIQNRGLELHYLKLSGLVIETEEGLTASNNLYTQILDKKWLNQSYGKIKRPITEDLQHWLNNGKQKEDLLSGTKLQIVEIWAIENDLTDSERDYLEASRLRKVRKRQNRIMSAVVVGGGILLGISGVWGLNQAKIATKNENIAKLQRDTSKMREKETSLLNVQLDSSLAARESIQFEDYLRRYPSQIRIEDCPLFLEDMIEIARDHPKKKIMQDTINAIVYANKNICPDVNLEWDNKDN